MCPVKRILTQTPGHHTTQLLGINDILELLRNQIRRVPRPEDIDIRVPVVLAAGFLIGFPILLCTTP